MKIIYIHQYFKFPDRKGGTRSYDLSKKFIDNNFNVIVLTSSSEKTSRRWNIYSREGIEVHELYVPYDNSFNKFKRIKSFWVFLFQTTFHLLKLKGDVVLATSTPLTIGIPAVINKWVKRTPFIFEVRDVWPEAVIAIGAIKNKFVQKLLYKLEYVIYKYAQHIVPLSPDMQQSIVSRYPKFSSKTNIVVENIAEINRFQNDHESINLEELIGFQPRFSILYAGTFGKVNGIDYVIELAEKTLDIDDKLVYILIGDGAEKEYITQMAKEKCVLNRNVFIVDPISKNELPKWYHSISMGSSFVIDIPELWANSANKFFDTLAAGKPILINHEGWQANIIREKNIGYVLPKSLTRNAVEDFILYTMKSNFNQININALTLAKEKYSLEVATYKYNKILLNV